jgi:hypothetical protein
VAVSTESAASESLSLAAISSITWRGFFQRFAAAVNNLSDVSREIWIDHRGRVFGERCGDLRQLTPPRLGGAQYGYRLSVALNDDLRARLHSVQHGVNVARQICFADV